MTYKYTDDGHDYFERLLVEESYTETIDSFAVGTGSSSPSNADTSLKEQQYRVHASDPNMTLERGSATGEIRTTITFTGGNEVPADVEIAEFGLFTSDDTFIYREVRSNPIKVLSGETKVVELRILLEDEDTGNEQTITNVGLEHVADMAIGDATQKLDTIAVGSGTGVVSETDTTMDNEFYRAGESDNDVTIATSGNVGEIRTEITVRAGDEPSDDVPPSAEIQEFGLFAGSTLILHEKRAAVILEASDSKRFNIPFTITQ